MGRKTKAAKIEDRIIAAFDFETDPFLHGRPVAPFCWGFKTREQYVDCWDDNPKALCERFVKFLGTLTKPHIIYAHNGGKFDWIFLIRYVSNPIKIINGRLVEARIGQHIIRDSYSIFPDSLSTYKKDSFDYRKLEADVRHKNREEILKYLRADCEYLLDIVEYFVGRFGFKLTIGSTAVSILRDMCPFDPIHESTDETLRPFYFGGRCEAIEPGVHRGEFKIIDVNSMYPDVMRNCRHGYGENYTRYSLIDWHATPFYFVEFEGTNNAALPYRTRDGLNFRVPSGNFHATSHEVKAALELGLIDIRRVKAIFVPDDAIEFSAYVDRFIDEKIDAKRSGDKLRELFSKRLLNSAYGKTGQNPDNHGDYQLLGLDQYPEIECDGEMIYDEEWELYEKHQEFAIWTRPARAKRYFDVGIAASITSAARAKLLRAMRQVKRPMYCDTDSLICEDSGALELDDYALGAWALEAEPNLLAIAGKKLYATFREQESGHCEFLKGANKGVRMHPSEIVRVCEGEQILCLNDAPTINFSGEQKFLARKIAMRII